MSEKRASKKKSAESFHSVAQIARRPSTDRRMDQREDFEAAVNRAVAAALQARGLGASPAASSSACAAAASPPKVLVTSRDLPEGLAMDFLSNHGYYLDDKGIAELRAEYLRVAPHLATMSDLTTKIQTAARNARSHISSGTRVALATSLPHTRTADGTVMFTDSGKVADDRSYRDLAPDKPFTSPTFHAVLRAVLKGRHNAYTAHDIAFVDFICDAALRHINLQKKSASGLEESYLRLVAEARQLEGMEIQADDKSPPIKIISCKTTRGKRAPKQRSTVPDDDEEDEKEDEEEEQEDESEEEAEESDDDEGSGISSLSSESRKRKVDDARPVDKNSRKTDEAGANSGEETGEEEDMPAAKKTPQRRDISVAYRTVAPAPVPEQGAAASRKRKADTAQAASEQKKRKEDNVGSGTDEPIPTSAKKKTPEKPAQGARTAGTRAKAKK